MNLERLRSMQWKRNWKEVTKKNLLELNFTHLADQVIFMNNFQISVFRIA